MPRFSVSLYRASSFWTSATRVVHWLHLINLHEHIIINQGSQFTLEFTLGAVHSLGWGIGILLKTEFRSCLSPAEKLLPASDALGIRCSHLEALYFLFAWFAGLEHSFLSSSHGWILPFKCHALKEALPIQPIWKEPVLHSHCTSIIFSSGLWA